MSFQGDPQDNGMTEKEPENRKEGDENLKKIKKKSNIIEKVKKRKKKAPKCIWVNVSHAYYPLVQESLEGIGYKITTSDTKANLIWINHNGNIDTASNLLPYQFYNHFPGMVAITRKIDCARNIDAVAKLMPEEYSFHPKSFTLPGQFGDLRNYMLSIKKAKQRTFIVKPDKGSLGIGIFLIQDPQQCYGYSEQAIAQKYIEPYLIDGLKFDLRIYVLVTSIEPLRIYVHEDGMARFCTEPYEEPSSDNLEKVFCHLTNYSLNKKNEHFQANCKVGEEEELEEKGHKRSMASIFESIKKDGHDIEKLKWEIDEIIRLTIASAQHYIASQYRIGCTSNDGKSRCFEILGFDIMIDKDCKPWLIEVNNKPSMAAESEFDRVLKTSVIQGAMKIINLQPNFKKQIGQRFHELAQLRVQSQRTQTLSDYDGETERAKETKWKQLYPLIDGDKSSIEKALDSARIANGFKPRKVESPQKQCNKSTTQLPSIQPPKQLQKTQSTTSVTKENDVSTEAAKHNKPHPPLSNRNITQSTPNIQFTSNGQRKIITPIHQRIVKPFTNNGSQQNQQKREVSTSKSCVANQIKALSKQKPVQRPALRYQQFVTKESPFFIEMRGFPTNRINMEEERERIKNLRRQQQMTFSTSTLSKVRNILQVISYPKKEPELPITGGAAVRSLRFSERSPPKQYMFTNYNFGTVIV